MHDWWSISKGKFQSTHAALLRPLLCSLNLCIMYGQLSTFDGRIINSAVNTRFVASLRPGVNMAGRAAVSTAIHWFHAWSAAVTGVGPTTQPQLAETTHCDRSRALPSGLTPPIARCQVPAPKPALASLPISQFPLAHPVARLEHAGPENDGAFSKRDNHALTAA